MQIQDLLGEAFARTDRDVRGVVQDLDAQTLAYRPDSEANSIAWLVWHTSRIQDDHVADLASREQIWSAEGWADRFDLPFSQGDTGFGHTSQQVAAVRPDGPDLLIGYYEAVSRQTHAYVRTLDTDQLDRIVDERWDPPVSVGVRLISVIHDGMQHLGQAAYVRGLTDRRPNP